MLYTAHVTDGAGVNPDTARLEIRASSESVVETTDADGEVTSAKVESDHGAQARIDLFGFGWKHAEAGDAVIDLGWRCVSEWRLVKDDGPRHWVAEVEPA